MNALSHGTTGGYWSHVLDNQRPCDECAEHWDKTHRDPPGTVYPPERVRPKVIRLDPYRNNPRG